MINWAKDHILIIGIVLAVVFILGGLATNLPGQGGVKDVPETKHTGHYEDGDKKYERR